MLYCNRFKIVSELCQNRFISFNLTSVGLEISNSTVREKINTYDDVCVRDVCVRKSSTQTHTHRHTHRDTPATRTCTDKTKCQ